MHYTYNEAAAFSLLNLCRLYSQRFNHYQQFAKDIRHYRQL